MAESSTIATPHDGLHMLHYAHLSLGSSWQWPPAALWFDLVRFLSPSGVYIRLLAQQEYGTLHFLGVVEEGFVLYMTAARKRKGS